MPRACDPPAISGGPPTESSHVVIVETFIVIALGPMMIRTVFSRVDWPFSTVRGVLGLNIDIFMSILGSVRRRRGRRPACGLSSFVFTINHLNRLTLMVVGT